MLEAKKKTSPECCFCFLTKSMYLKSEAFGSSGWVLAQTMGLHSLPSVS